MNNTATQMPVNAPGLAVDSPFLAENDDAYAEWRRQKLALWQACPPDRVFTLDSAGQLPAESIPAARRQIEAHNFVLFQSRSVLDKKRFISLNRQFGLCRLDRNAGADDDSVTSLRVASGDDPRARYIPYTDRALGWHTDGYYNAAERRIRAFSLYCRYPAASGGANFLLDHEMIYLRLRDQDPAAITALMQADMLRIPPNNADGREIRGVESGPVFSLLESPTALHMRFTSRPRFADWKTDASSQAALTLLRGLLDQATDRIKLRLESGQGLICNNLLHGRESFVDSGDKPARLLYRARYLDGIDLDPRGGD